MLDDIRNCSKCKLCLNQKPLVDTSEKCQVIWVGLSAKRAGSDKDIPLSKSSNSGAIIQRIEEEIDGVTTYKTNLVKCPPLDEKLKLRYPNRQEIEDCFCNLDNEIAILGPKVVILLGEKVSSSVARRYGLFFEKSDGFNYRYVQQNGIYYVPVHHPSYVHIYRRKQLDVYINSICALIQRLLEPEE